MRRSSFAQITSIAETLFHAASALLDCGITVGDCDVLARSVNRAVLRALVFTMAERRLRSSANPQLTDAARFIFDDWSEEVSPEALAGMKRRVPELLQILDGCRDQVVTIGTRQLGMLYEHLLGYAVRSDDGVLRMSPLANGRRRAGVFYTPEDIAAKTVALTLSPLLEHGMSAQSMRVVDPAMGSGVFLLCTLDFLAAHSDEDKRDIARRLYGVDLDPIAVDLGKLALWLETDDVSDHPSNLYSNLRCGNSLVGDWLSDLQLLRKADSSGELRTEMDQRCAQYFDSGFFHWQIEYPEIFSGEIAGFDAVVTNPPWEIEKPNSREFFGRVDQSFWTLSKQDAVRRQIELLGSDPALTRKWNAYLEAIVQMSKWVRARPFVRQGGADVNAYKLFLELAHDLLRDGGMLGQVVPAGIYSDKGTAELRKFFIRENKWRAIRAFENRDGKFDIHRSFKYCITVVEKGGSTQEVDCTFASNDDARSFKYKAATISGLSPRWSALMELESERDLEIIEKICSVSTTVGSGGAISFSREFDMTNDSRLFVSREALERRGYVADEYGHWLHGRWRPLKAVHTGDALSDDLVLSADGNQCVAVDDIFEVYLPLYEGRSIGHFDFSRKQWLSGKGRRALWSEQPFSQKRLNSQYYVNRLHCECIGGQTKIGYLGVGSPTNARSMIAACINDLPCGNSVQVLRWKQEVLNSPQQLPVHLILTACLNSFVFDYVLRCRMTANNLNWFIVEECPLPPVSALQMPQLVAAAASLSFIHPSFAPAISALDEKLRSPFTPVLDEGVRRELRARIEAIVAHAYGIAGEDFAWILRDCGDDSDVSGRINPKGFWRVDRDQPPGSRLTLLALKAFDELNEGGVNQALLALSGLLESNAIDESPWWSARNLNLHSKKVTSIRKK